LVIRSADLDRSQAAMKRWPSFLGSPIGPQAQRDRRVGQLDHGVDRGTVPQLIGVKPTEADKARQPLCIDGDTQTISRINARWAALTAFSSDPIVGVVRCAFLTPSQRAWCARDIPQIAYGDDNR
jgi:hypothetical protein